MSREDLHFRLRLPADLKAEIEAAAEANAKSMTAEIVARLRDREASLRDRFAGQALAGIAETYLGAAVDPAGYARAAYAYADAMLAERAKGGDA